MCKLIFRLELGEVLGEGAFGRVVKGYAHQLHDKTDVTVVAVKMLKGIII